MHTTKIVSFKATTPGAPLRLTITEYEAEAWVRYEARLWERSDLPPIPRPEPIKTWVLAVDGETLAVSQWLRENAGEGRLTEKVVEQLKRWLSAEK